MNKNKLTDADIADFNNRFTYHSPKNDQAERYATLRSRGGELAIRMMELCPESAERTLAIRKIEEALFWANASIARNE